MSLGQVRVISTCFNHVLHLHTPNRFESNLVEPPHSSISCGEQIIHKNKYINLTKQSADSSSVRSIDLQVAYVTRSITIDILNILPTLQCALGEHHARIST